MRNLISIATIILALLAVRAVLSLVMALDADGAWALLLPQAVVLVLSGAGLVYWQRKEKFGTQLLLGAWAVAVAIGVSSAANGSFISLQAIAGVPILVLLVLSLRKGNTNGSST